MKPLIHLFRTPNRCYCYDAVCGQIFIISETSFAYLSELLRGNDIENEPEEITQLKNSGFLSNSPVETLRHPYTKYLELMLSRKLDHITLQVTQNCNLRCRYCIYSESNGKLQRHHSPKKMTWETAKRALDFLWEHSIDSEEMSVSFYGGEPLLEYPLIKKCIAYSKVRFRGKKLRFNLTTNSTLLTDEMVHYFARNNVDIMISLDGVKDINDRNRVFAGGKGTFDTIMHRIHRIREIEPEYAKTVKISMVMDPSNDFDCINELTINYCDIEPNALLPAMVEHLDAADPVIYSDTFSNKYSYQIFLAWLAYLGRYPVEEVSPIAHQALIAELSLMEKHENTLPLQSIDCPSGPCVAGHARLFCNVDGNLFPCERVSETSEAMLIGNIFSDIDCEAAKRLTNVAQTTDEVCKQCWCFRFCVLCAKKADVGTIELSGNKKLSHCSDSANSAYHVIMGTILQNEVKEFYSSQICSPM
jgi:uncharacterized protein